MSRKNVKVQDLFSLLEKFTSTVLKEDPEDVVGFAVGYFEHLKSCSADECQMHSGSVCAAETATNLVRKLVTPTIEVNAPGESTRAVSFDQAGRSELGVPASGSKTSSLSASPSGDSMCQSTAGPDDTIINEDHPLYNISRLELSTADRNFVGHCGSRRGSVAAESYDPEKEEKYEPTAYPKSPEQRQRLMTAFKTILIFRSLDEEQKTKVLDAMREMPVKAGQTIIQQGDDGEYFYVIESGTFDIFVNESPEGCYKGTGSFGELALMYNTPRAATIVCTQDGVLWAVDRSTFRRIVLHQAFEKRQHYEKLLYSVPLLSNLSAYERTNVADALVRRVYDDGQWIVRQGEHGDEMYFIEEGTVKITTKNLNNEETLLKILNQNDYFGELALILHEPRHASAQAVGKTKLAVLDVSSFERLMGPCLEVMLREATQYRSQLLNIFGDACLNTFPALARLTESMSSERST